MLNKNNKTFCQKISGSLFGLLVELSWGGSAPNGTRPPSSYIVFVSQFVEQKQTLGNI